MVNIGDIKHGKALGLKDAHHYQWLDCLDCGWARWVQLHKDRGKPVSIRCRACNRARKGKNSSAWKGGKIRGVKGYIHILLYPDDFFYSMAKKGTGYVLEHRLIMARYLGRCLTRFEVVHHKNGIKDDNRMGNLELTTRSGHVQDYSYGYRKGYTNGRGAKIKELEATIACLRRRLPPDVDIRLKLTDYAFAGLTAQQFIEWLKSFKE